MSGRMMLAIVLVAPLVAYFLGIHIGRVIRMREYGWKLGVILSTVVLGGAITYFYWPPKLGIDLSGGVILVYEVDQERTVESASQRAGGIDAGASDVDMSALVQALQRRINPSGVRELIIRQYGANQVEIIVPQVTENEIDQIKKIITKSGYLKFRILANEQDHGQIIELANLMNNSDNPAVRASKYVKQGDRVVAEWVRIARDEKNPQQYKVEVDDRVKRELVEGQPEALMIVDPDPIFHVDGSHLRSVSTGFDSMMQPSVDFWMTSRGALLFGALTSSNLPDKQSGLYRQLGIVMDDELISAPRVMSKITDQGEITGRFTQDEVDFLVNVLQAGRLPAVLHDEPISENTINPLLGMDTIRKGSFSIVVSLAAVVIFILFYYLFSGVIACMALVLNLLLVVAVMILINAAFTLPGLAGLVLTVGMSVDANVLIFERMREELNRGAALRMAIRNGFDRATTAIVDSNVTTLITAIVLYVIGSDQIRGFAVTLILGIVISMYTAIFCSRVIFDVADRKRWITRLKMFSILGATQIDFMRLGKIAGAMSILVIGVGLAGAFVRGQQIFDIDFLGGTSVQAVLNRPLPIEKVRALASGLADDVSVTQVNTREHQEDTVYKIDTSLERVEALEQRIRETFRDQNGETLLVMHKMSFTTPVEIESSEEAAAGLSSREHTGDAASDKGASAGAADAGPSSTGRSPVLMAMADSSGEQEREPPQPAPARGNTSETAAPAAGHAGGEGPVEFRSHSQLTFEDRLSATTLKEEIERIASSLELEVPELQLSNPKWNGRSEAVFSRWDVKLTSDPEQSRAILEKLQQEIGNTPYLLSASTIGGAVAGKTQVQAILALVGSLLGIIVYLWIRFQRVDYGLAAVVAVLHDAAVTIGAVALSSWLSPAFGFLLVDEFKISLPVVAAVLTIIGYSLNDTIVIFDRLREVKGRSPEVTEAMLNTSLNQTLSRTILTSATVLLVVIVLYALGGQGIHGFSFAMLVGVVAGTYSTVFIASPILLWLSRWSRPAAVNRKQAA